MSANKKIRFFKVCNKTSISLNKNTCPGDKSAMTPGGLRLGAPALTSRGFVEKDFEQVCVSKIVIKLKQGSVFCETSRISFGLKLIQLKQILSFQVVEFFHQAIEIATEVKQKTNKLKDYKDYLESNDEIKAKMAVLKNEVNQFSIKFPMPGFEDH